MSASLLQGGPLAPESPISLTLNGQQLVTLMASPSQLDELALGWLFCRGIIRSASELTSLGACESLEMVSATMSPSLAAERSAISLADVVPSGCGSGVGELELPGLAALPAPSPLFSLEQIKEAAKQMFDSAELYRQSGGMHCAAVLWPEGLIVREDVGRHNAVDKAVGAALRLGLDFSTCALLSSGRIAADMALKAWAAGIGLVASRSIPTTGAERLRQAAGITILGRVMSDKPWIYGPQERLVGKKISP